MKFDIKFISSAYEDLEFYKIREQKIILYGIEKFLQSDADVESKKRKQLRPNPLAPWELRIGDYRVFYEIKSEYTVKILSIGHKVHNDLFIQGKRVEL